MNNLSDRALFDLISDESTRREGFTLLVRQYQQCLYWLIRRLVISHDDADDVLQNTLIRVWKGLPEFRGESKIYSWLYRIAYNEAVSFLRNKRKDLALSADAFANFMSNQLCDDPNVNCSEVEEKLQQALLHLPEKQRMVFSLRYYDEMPYDEMSDILDTSVGALKSSYHLAMKKIEHFLLND
jgi:RNA polymerase sigma-70 factor (ECF subfamily)